MIDLMKFVEKDNPHRNYLMRPWSVGEYTYATNGHIGVRVPRRDDVPENPKAPDMEGRVLANAPLAKNLQPIPTFVMPTLTKACPDCNGFGIVKKCPDCDGKGIYECGECGHEASCKTCDETGEQKIKTLEEAHAVRRVEKAIKCDVCDGTQTVENERIWARLNDTLWVNPRYLAIIAELPNALLDLGADGAGRPVRFTFDGGEGVLMPMRAPMAFGEFEKNATILDLRPGSQITMPSEAAE